MEFNFVYLVICMVLLLISLCTQLAGMASEGWLVVDLDDTSEKFNFGLYYVDYCRNGSCTIYYITDLPSTAPLGIGNIALDKLFSVYRAGTALAAALTLLAAIFLSRYTTQCCASWQTCARHNGHVTCLNCFTLAAGLFATSAAAHYGTEIAVRSEELDVFATPYSIILTGLGGILALIAFFLLAALSCRETEQKEEPADRKFVTPEEYFEKAAPYVSDDIPTKVPQPPRSESTLPSSTLTRTYKSGHFVDNVTVGPPKRRVENIELPPISTTKVNPGYLHQPGSKVYYVTLR